MWMKLLLIYKKYTLIIAAETNGYLHMLYKTKAQVPNLTGTGFSERFIRNKLYRKI